MVTRNSLISLLLLVAGCAAVLDHPRLTVAEVVRLADAEARRGGYDLRAFERSKPRYNYVVRDSAWYVFYDGKSVNGMSWVGNHFSVDVDDQTKKVLLIPGR